MVDGSPQAEEGHTRIANELLEAVLAYGFSKRQLEVILFIFRKTYGWQRKQDYITGGQISSATKMSDSAARQTIRELVRLNVVHKDGRLLSVNKYYHSWISDQNSPVSDQNSPSETGSKQSGIGSKQSGLGGAAKNQTGSKQSGKPDQNDPTPDQNDPVNRTDSVRTKETKETIQKKGKKNKGDLAWIEKSFYNEFWPAYPLKKSKAAALKSWCRIFKQPNQVLLTRILRSLDDQTQERKIHEDRGIWIADWKHPTTWLNQKCWEDEVNLDPKPQRKQSPANATHNFDDIDYSYGANDDGSF